MASITGKRLQRATDDQVRRRVNLLIHNRREEDGVRLERRRVHRCAYPYPAYLTPLDEDGVPLTEETVVVLGKHLSELGLDFYHQEALPYRRMIASFECGEGRWLAFEMDLSWCRFGRHGYYENGGRFVRSVESPLGAANDALIA